MEMEEAWARRGWAGPLTSANRAQPLRHRSRPRQGRHYQRTSVGITKANFAAAGQTAFNADHDSLAGEIWTRGAQQAALAVKKCGIGHRARIAIPHGLENRIPDAVGEHQDVHA